MFSRRHLLFALALVLALCLVWTAVSSGRGPDRGGSHPEARTGESTEPILRGRDSRSTVHVPGSPGDMERAGVRMIRIRGTVLDDDYRPARGANVSAVVAGKHAETCTCNEAGAYLLELSGIDRARSHIGLSALRGGLAASTSIRIAPGSDEEIRAETLVLTPGSKLPVHVTWRGEGVAETTVHAAWHAPDDPSRSGAWDFPWRGWVASATTDAHGMAILGPLPDGDVRLLAVHRGQRLRGEVRIASWSSTQAVEVPLEVARDVRVRVLGGTDGTPLEGCRLVLLRDSSDPWGDPQAPARTDAAGESVLPCLPPRCDLTINVVGEGFVYPFGAGMEAGRVPDDVSEFVIHVPDIAEIRLPIQVQEGPFPEDGTPVHIEAGIGEWGSEVQTDLPRHAAVANGQLVLRVRRDARRAGRAVLPDGRAALFRASTKRPEPVIFKRAHELLVRVRDADTGAPVPDAAVGVGRSGSFPGPFVHHAVATEADGTARFQALPAGRYWIAVTANREAVPKARWGRFGTEAAADLREGPQTVDVLLPPVQDAALRVMVGDRPEFPRGMRIYVWTDPGQVGYRPLDRGRWDATAGIVWLPLRARRPTKEVGAEQPARAASAIVTAPGFAQEWVPIRWDAKEGRFAGTAKLKPAAALTAHVPGPKGQPLSATLLRLDPVDGWQEWTKAAPTLDDRPANTYLALPPGTYRLAIDAWDLYGPPFDLSPGGREVTWDLRESGWVTGRVELPADIDPDGLRIHVEGDPDGEARKTDGNTFKVRVSGNRPVRIRATHPACATTNRGDTIEVRTPADGLLLRLLAK
ncbi:MAG: carboxypeptidase regulatory-like domain-containing protein [Planctomycetes bacterium]|nr:carboxypeptidase regulatory-like domain-containing protein [Planctomycetota bacterium]